MIPTEYYIFLATGLFIIGVVGVLTRRNVLIILMSIELILNAVNINLMAFSQYFKSVDGQVFAIFVITDAAAEALILTRDIVPEQADLYALKVRGTSMIDAMVNDGDIVVMKKQAVARDGDMVAVRLLDRDETTLKHFYHEAGRVRLQPANPTLRPIYAHPANCEIQGRVVAVIRQVH